MSDKDDGAPPRRPWQSYHTVFTNAKAGMDGVDKEKVQKIVYEMSKGSKYFENEEKKEAFIKQKIENMRSQCAKLTPADISHYQTIADKKIAELEVTRDLSKIWLHVDMDAFYAAVETLHNPSLKGKPMAVGGMSMISTANYEARKFGVRAAMPGFIARKLCPELIFVPPDFKKYTRCSDLTRKVFYRYDPNFIASSLDEAYLDITEICKARGISSEEIASELRTGVYEETGLTCSAGVAPNRMIAKVCSDINKPNGHFVLPNDRMAVMTFISSLPIRKIGGIGKVTEHVLRDVFGISTCEEILQKSAYLCALFSQSSIDFFLSVGLGLGKTETPQIGSRKSISCERTFSTTEDEASLYSKIEEIAVSLSRDMEKEGLSGRTLTLKLKTASFEVRTRAISLQKSIFSSEDILLHACKLLKAELPLSLRLIGLRMSHFNDDKFVPDPTQKTLSSYIISGNKSAKDKSDISSLCSDTSNTSTVSGKVTGLPIDANGFSLSDADLEYGYGEPSNSKQFPYFEINSSVLSNATGEMDYTYMNLPGEYQAKVASPQSTGYATPTKEAVGLKMVDGEKNQSLWVDDYKCSLCGVELPPSFLEERQEHSDYHYAEMLQRKESQHNTSNFMQRVVEKIQVTGKNGRKKQKTSPKDCKHIPIDLFFVKSNQNF